MDINDILQARGKIIADMRTMLDTAESDNRDLNSEDQVSYDKMDADQTELKARVDRAASIAEIEASNHGVDRDPMRPSPSDSATGTPFASSDYAKAFDEFARKGQNGITHDIRAALQVGTDSEGGYIVPAEYDANLVVALQSVNEMRNICNVITTGSDRNIPVESTLGTAAWTAEEAAYTESDPAFGTVVLNSYKLARIVKVSEELLQDSEFDLPSYLTSNFGSSFGIAEETAFVNGNGTGKPTGAVQGSTAGVNAASNAAITTDELMDLYHALKRQYRSNGTWLMNDSTIKLVRKLKDSQNQYLWQPGLSAGQPDMLFNRPVLATDGMPAVATVAKSVLFGDFSYYTIADRTGRVVMRLNELYAANGQVGFKMMERVDGKVTLAEAIQHLVHPV